MLCSAPTVRGRRRCFAVLGLLRGYQGRILVDGTEARTLSARELAHRIAYIPQIHGEAFAYSALEMVLMGTTHSISPFSAPKEKETAAALAALERLGIAHLAEQSFFRLSGGEQQRVAIARALANSPKLLLADEPTGNLDPNTAEEVFAALLGIIRETGLAALIATHNMELAARMNRQFKLKDGILEDINEPLFAKVRKNFY